MILIRLLLTLAIPLLLGCCVVAFIYKKKQNVSFLERFALAWGIGLGLLGLEMFTISLIGISLTLYIILVPTLSVTFALGLYLLAKKIPIFDAPAFKKFIKSIIDLKNEKNQWTKTAQILLILLIAATILYVFFDALVKPIANFDALWRQGCIAKIIFTSGKVLTEQSVELAGPHPYLNPISQAWIYLGIGNWNDALGKIVFALCFTSLIFIFYSGVRRYATRFHSLLFTYLLTSFPLIIYHAGTAYSDLMQTFYYTAGIIFLFHWLMSKNNPDLYVSAVFLGIGVFVKQLGTPLWIIATAVLFLYILLENNRQFKPFLQFILLFSLVGLPWLVNKQSFLPANIVILWNKLLPQANGPAAPAPVNTPYGQPTPSGILFHLIRRMYLYADWQILWFVFPASIIVFWQQFWQSKLKYLALIILLNLLMIIYGFTEQNAYNYLVDGTLVQRMLMYQVPVVLFITALIIKELLTPQKSPK